LKWPEEGREDTRGESLAGEGVGRRGGAGVEGKTINIFS